MAAIAAPLLKSRDRRLAAFTEVPRPGFAGPLPDGRYADETPFVQLIARRHDNIDLNLVRAEQGWALDNVESFFSCAEVPFRNAANCAWYDEIVRRAQGQGVRVLLNGDPGNLTASWTGSGLPAELMRRGRWSQALSEALAAARRGETRSAARALAGSGLLPLLPAPLLVALERLRGGSAIMSPKSFTAFSPILPDFAAAQGLPERWRTQMEAILYENRADGKMARYRVLTGSAVGGMIVAGYRALFGLELRAPLADARIVEFCLALPEEQYRRNGEPRWLIRRAMADHLPAEVLGNRMRGLQAADWFERLNAHRAEAAAELERLEQSPLARRVLDLARLRRLVEQWPQAGGGDTRLVLDYRSVLELGLMVGRFLRWFEAGG